MRRGRETSIGEACEMETRTSSMSTSRKRSGNAGSRALRAIRKKTQAVTLAPRLLGTRVKHLLRDELYIDVSIRNAPTVVTNEIANLELLAAYHRWLRGVHALLAIVVFVLSLVRADVVVNWTILAVSIAAILIIIKVYGIKAEYTGLTNVMYKENRSVLTSPFVNQMFLEILIWIIQTPPIILFWRPFFELLNYFIFIRLYVIVVYIHNAVYVHRTFCRAMAAVVGLPLSISFTIRTALVYSKAKVTCFTILISWISIGCMYSKAEHVSLSDGLWFSFQTLSTVGYGDLSPTTTTGRLVTVLAWIVSFLLIAYMVVILHGSLVQDENEYNMYVLMRCHKLSHKVRNESARVIQKAWRFHRASLQLPQTRIRKVKTLLQAWSLTHTISRLRYVRQDWVYTTRLFRERRHNPIVGLSEYKHREELYIAQCAARHTQRQSDVDAFMQLLLKKQDKMPTREEVEQAIISNSLDNSFSSFLDGARAPNVVTTSAVPSLDIGSLFDKVEDLETKCRELTTTIESLLATAATNPPSLAHSHER
ncbi:putative ion transport protein [Trypanosoma theileri]|uniref:Putative ion transport protein n=1 Tax=Trypanosoma theileri TaxID=67003 RepID=A0A1X0NNP7_9TRYP|nr:putative ion transport protein [Trypanosoma theileri]ORC86317.1 putative ion transport protein [Trypanosoma theileri]